MSAGSWKSRWDVWSECLRGTLVITVIAICLWQTMPGACQAGERIHPNVVVFLADDAGWGDYSRNVNTQVRTPHIDSSAANGVTLDRFFVCPVCAPTRAEFLTGRYHPRGGVKGVSTGQERLDLTESTIADAFKAQGYATGAFGKWHNGSQWPYHPMARGFDEYFGHSSGHWGEYFDAPLEDSGRMIRTEGYIADVCTAQAMGFIERNQSRPFFCFIPFTTPHSPWAVPDEYWNRFRNKEVILRATKPDDENVDETRCALAMMENQDDNVGRVLGLLDRLNLSRDTIVVYFSDNGPNSARWNGGMRGRKATTDEGGVRSTCFIRWPEKFPAGHLVSEISAAIDLLPTLCSLTGVPRAGELPLDGRDLSLLLTNKVSLGSGWEDRMIFSTWAGRVSVRTQKYRLDDQGRLYHMADDPGQIRAIHDTEPDVAERLKDQVVRWRADVLKAAVDPNGKSIAKKKTADFLLNRVDPRPFPVGYREFPRTMLPARDGEPKGSIRRSSQAPNCSYFVNWTGLDDSIVWNIDVHTSGTYEATIDYTCPLNDAGSEIELSFRSHSVRARVEPGWDPPLNDDQDTLPRPHGESQMKEFRTLNAGRLQLEAGQGLLTLRALQIPGRSVMDVRRVTLTLVED
ncbi:MAG: arylsulfatase [Planctomycetota bacterium]